MKDGMFRMSFAQGAAVVLASCLKPANSLLQDGNIEFGQDAQGKPYMKCSEPDGAQVVLVSLRFQGDLFTDSEFGAKKVVQCGVSFRSLYEVLSFYKTTDVLEIYRTENKLNFKKTTPGQKYEGEYGFHEKIIDSFEIDVAIPMQETKAECRMSYKVLKECIQECIKMKAEFVRVGVETTTPENSCLTILTEEIIESGNKVEHRFHQQEDLESMEIDEKLTEWSVEIDKKVDGNFSSPYKVSFLKKILSCDISDYVTIYMTCANLLIFEFKCAAGDAKMTFAIASAVVEGESSDERLGDDDF